MSEPWVNDTLYTPYKLAALIDVMRRHGVPAEAVLSRTGLSPAQLDDPETKTSVAQYVAACRNVMRLRPEPSLPFEIGRSMHLSIYGMYGYVMLCSTSMRAFFDNAIRYHRLATPTYVLEWEASGDRPLWRFVRPTMSLLEPELQAFLLAHQIVQHVVHMRDGLGPDYLPIHAVLPKSCKPWAAQYEEALACPITWEEHLPEVYHDASIMDRPAPLAHKLTSTLMQATCDRLIGQTKTSSGVSGRVYQILMARQRELPTMEDVAEMLHMNERTLRRKLEVENTSFAAILDEIRHSLAREYLNTTRMTTEDIAELVGFDNAANFRRAFKRWTGKTPRDYRTQA